MTEAKSNWARVCEEEAWAIRARQADLAKTGKCTCRFPPNTVGLALSGGGIRSATFSLGLMRSLSQQRLIHCIDYLSTVSGGGYAGAFYCSLFVPNESRGPAPMPPATLADDEAEAEPGPVARRNRAQPSGRRRLLRRPGVAAGAAAIAQLRQGGHYLAPNGTSDALFAAVIAIRNWFAVAIAIGVALLALFFFINFAVVVLDPLLVRSE